MKKVILFAVSTFCLCSCKNTGVEFSGNQHYEPGSDYYLPSNDVRLVSAFEQELELSNPTLVEIDDNIAIRRFQICGNIMASQSRDENDLLQFTSAEDYEWLGHGLSVGGGPEEVPSGNFSFNRSSRLYEKGDSTFLSIYHMYKPFAMDINITKSIATHRLECVNADSLPSELFSCIKVGDHRYFTKTLTPDQTQQLVHLWENGKMIETETMKNLNLAHVGEDFNLLGSLLAVKPDGKWIAECMVGLNQINFIPLGENEKGFTISVGSALDAISAIEEKSRADRMITYQGASVTDDYVCFLYLGQTEMDYELNRGEGHDEIHCLGWDGKPLARLRLDRPIRYFSINKTRKTILVMDLEDNMWEYNLPEFK